MPLILKWHRIFSMRWAQSLLMLPKGHLDVEQVDRFSKCTKIKTKENLSCVVSIFLNNPVLRIKAAL